MGFELIDSQQPAVIPACPDLTLTRYDEERIT